MMGRLNHDQAQLFIHFILMKQFRTITRFARSLRFSTYHGFVLSWRPFTPKWVGPRLIRSMIRMLIIGNVFAIRSERAICRDVQVNLAYRWFCGLSIEDKIPDHSVQTQGRAWLSDTRGALLDLRELRVI